MSALTINVDVGISDCLRILKEIADRKADRKGDYLEDVCDDLDALERVIKTFDDLFIELTGAYACPPVVDHPESLETLKDETMKYLKGRDLLPALEDLIGNIMGIAYNRRLKGREYRDLVSTLRNLEKRLNTYRDELGRGAYTCVGQTKELNLMSLWEKASKKSPHKDIALTEMAEEVFRNHDFDLSDSIYRLVGRSKAHAKAAKL